jgi:hypothetical protein
MNSIRVVSTKGAGIAQSVQRLATGWTIRRSNHGGARFFAHVQTGPVAHPASCKVGTGSFPGVKRPGRGADHPLLLVRRSRKSRVIPLTPSGPSGLLQGTFTFSFYECKALYSKLRRRM